MEKIPNCCTFASLVALVILVSFPVRSWCEEDAYKSLPEEKPECCVSKDAEMKRLDDIDYDSFVSLMGRRSAPQPDSNRNNRWSRKRMACPCAQTEYLQTRRGGFITHNRQRF
ncbi:tachykinin-3b [Thunnus thynnus]|uniref:tachykinin-3b n=1 Tax=Thunnus thynnus TaxID=8237 RepID=UPI00352811EF